MRGTHFFRIKRHDAQPLQSQLSVPLQADGQTAIEILNRHYLSKQLLYIIPGPKTFPVFGPLERAAVRLLIGVGDEVGYPPKDLPNLL